MPKLVYIKKIQHRKKGKIFKSMLKSQYMAKFGIENKKN